MFSDIGSKIKTLAKTIFVFLLLIVTIAVISILIISRGDSMSILVSLLVAILGGFVSWLSVIVLYAFGELVDNSTKIRECLEAKATASQRNRVFAIEQSNGSPLDLSKKYIAKKDGAVRPVKNMSGQKVACPFCGTYNSRDICSYCGAVFREESKN